MTVLPIKWLFREDLLSVFSPRLHVCALPQKVFTLLSTTYCGSYIETKSSSIAAGKKILIQGFFSAQEIFFTRNDCFFSSGNYELLRRPIPPSSIMSKSDGYQLCFALSII